MTPIEAAIAAVDDEIAVVRQWGQPRLTAEAERCVDLLAHDGAMFWWSETDRRAQRRRAGKPFRDGGGVETNPDNVATALTRGLAILALRNHGVYFDAAHFCDNRHGGRCQRGEITFPHEPDTQGIKDRGAMFTPRHLAEMVTGHALDGVVYSPGPVQTSNRDEWKLLPGVDILDKTVCDIAMGTGAFPVAAVRYLTARIMEQVPGILKLQEQRFRLAVIARCVYGADIHPGSVAIARLVMALMVPFVDVDAVIWCHLVCGDSLLGITSLDQLKWMHMDPEKGNRIHFGIPPLGDNFPVQERAA